MDAQYKFLKIVCRKSKGKDWVSYSSVCKAWGRRCPSQTVISNLANYTYVDIDYKAEHLYFPRPEAFSYVRQCRDSIRNLIVTTATLAVAIWTLIATL